MIVSGPAKWAAVIALLRSKGLLPTTLDTAALDLLEAAIRRQATFSAKVTNARFLQLVADIISRIIEPDDEPGSYMDVQRGSDILRAFLDDMGYQAPDGKAGTIEDLASYERLELIVRMNTQMAQGYGQWVQSNTNAAVVDAFPCAELFRLQRVEEPRQANAGNQFRPGDGYGGYFWPNKWKGAGGKFYGGGRMIARKGSPIWAEISRFGNPYPPFDFNSGMWVKSVPRHVAEQLGVIEKGEKVPPQSLETFGPMQADLRALAPELQQRILAAVPDSKIEDGILTQEKTS